MILKVKNPTQKKTGYAGRGDAGMLALDEELFEEYKRVDGICRDMFASQRGVSEYIEQMERDFVDGQQRIPSWEQDYRALKRVRWLRNQIAHEMTATDCTSNDVAYIRDFHDRLLHQEDPLAVLRRLRSAAQPTVTQRKVVAQKRMPHLNRKSTNLKEIFPFKMIAAGVLVALFVLVVLAVLLITIFSFL